MTIQLKSTLVVLATFLLGMVIGGLGDHWLMRPLFNAREFRHPAGFLQFNEQVIQPQKSQRDTVRAILLKYHQKFEALAQQHRSELTAMLDTLHLELAPVLTEEQRSRLQQRREIMPDRPLDRPGHFPGDQAGPRPAFHRPPDSEPAPEPGAEGFPPPPEPGRPPEDQPEQIQ
jgi:hypothetical protein